MKTDFENNGHTVTDAEWSGLNALNGTLRYLADGEEVVVTGEFWFDKNEVGHHTHEFEDGTEIEILF